jgi:hypothetical protein
MNIFYLAHSVDECAQYHVDRHTVKMILEYAQLLSTAHRVLDGVVWTGLSSNGRKVKRWKLSDSTLDQKLYTATHINHPSAIWARQSEQNYLWLANMLIALCKEYTHRYGKIHKVENDGLCYTLLNNVPKNIRRELFTEPTPAMPEEYKVKSDSIKSYRNYYNGAKARMFNWKKREVPEWIKVS